jgi:hypothetical protein
MPVDNVFCGRFWREGEREREKPLTMHLKLVAADERRKGYVWQGSRKVSMWDQFFSLAAKQRDVVRKMQRAGGSGGSGGLGGGSWREGAEEEEEEEEAERGTELWQGVQQRLVEGGMLVPGGGAKGKEGWNRMIQSTLDVSSLSNP